MNEAEVMYECQVCYKLYAEEALVAVKDIEYRAGHRVFPWHICLQCAEKIGNALYTKVAGDWIGKYEEGKSE